MRRRAFSLIELLVIIGIIVVLIGILIPTLGAVYAKGYKTRTQGVINDLEAALSSYYTQFHAYPGPASAVTTTTVGAGKVGGAQNLLNGLGGGIDNSVTNPDGSHPQLQPFFAAVTAAGGKTPNVGTAYNNGAAIDSAASPVVIDAYGDALPILYYRRTPGAAAAAASAPTSTTIAAYYLNENIEYTSASKLAASSSANATTYDQTTGGLGGATALNYLANLVVNNPSSDMTTPPPSPAQVHGEYMLLDAGPDRIYGTPDDIVIVGG